MKMTETEFFQKLQKSFCDNAFPDPSKAEAHAFYLLLNELLEANKVTNLTAITDPDQIIAKHFVDSLLGCEQIPKGAAVLDLGCGAGFPSLPLAIHRPDLTLIALDSTAKKVAFVQKTAEKLQLSNLKTLIGRAEDPALKKQIGHIDLVVSRAVARLNLLCELSFPLLPIGGALFALKGAKGQEELAEAQKAVKILGGSSPVCASKQLRLLDGTIEERSLIWIPKTKETPKEYPRSFAIMQKKPL